MEAHTPGLQVLSESDEEEEEILGAHGTCAKVYKCNILQITENAKETNCGPLMTKCDPKNDKGLQTVKKIALELLSTERTYVSILYLLDQIFAFRIDQENRVHSMFPQDVVTQMFTNLKSLYKLHNDFLLPQLEERLTNWEQQKGIGDIMKNFAPFLKMYSEYVQNYDNAVNLINFWCHKSPKFAQILSDLQALEECKHLSLQHHMLTPIQRVPRYQLLLKDYLKKLPDDSSDKKDTEKALELVSVAANHANDAMKKIDKFKKLLEIQELIGGTVDLVSPSRELVNEGRIIKISARSGDHQERYLFLFSDLLLLCSQKLIPNRVVPRRYFRVRAQLDITNLVIEEGDNLETPNAFYIYTPDRLIELYTHTLNEKIEWMEALAMAVCELSRKKSSLRSSCTDSIAQNNVKLGSKAPELFKMESVTHCMACDSGFSTFTLRRKHHCHSCGIVVCSRCLPYKVQLTYEGGKPEKVCNNCYDTLIQNACCNSIDGRPKSIENTQKRKGILDVNSGDPSVVSGYLHFKARSRFWVRRWFALHEDFVLYSFSTHLDEMALTSMPVPGYTVSLPTESDAVDGRENVFKLSHKKKVYFFQTDEWCELQRWVFALEKAAKAECIS